MNATMFFILMLLARLVIPFSLVLWLGETAHRRQLEQHRRLVGSL